jgi:hypothetical protein
MTEPAKCYCGSRSWERRILGDRYICCSCKRPLWQPIETAPRDGRTILAYGCWPNFPSVPDVAFVYWDEDSNWWAFDGEEMLITHWMHLPEPPKL